MAALSSCCPEFRNQFPHIQKGVCYLNHAAQSPLPETTVRAMHEHLLERHSGSLVTYERNMALKQECRERVARLIHAPSPELISFVTNTSEGLNHVTSGLQWHPGDEIILNNIEFPSNVHPYLKLQSQGVRCVFVDASDGTIPVERLEQAITPRTRAIAISAVQYLSGYFADMEAIGALCRDRGLLFFVDGIQAAGVVPVDVQRWQADAFATGSLKWLMGPTGIGFLYLSERLCSELKTPSPGWLSVEDPWDLRNYDQPVRSGADRYEGGVLNMPGICGLNASVTLLMNTGIESIYHNVKACNTRLRSAVTSMGMQVYTCDDEDRQSGILTMFLNNGSDADDLEHSFAEQHIHISLRDGKLRVSPHGYTTFDDIDCFIEQLQALQPVL